MLHEFLAAERPTLIDRCKSKVALRLAPTASGGELEHGIPFFLDQVIQTLRIEQTSDPMRSRKVSGSSGGVAPATSDVAITAAQHGCELSRGGFTVDQVVHDYGDLCQAITELAFERQVTISVQEFQTLNRCLDNAIAEAVTEFVRQRNLSVADKQRQTFNEQLGVLAHELRNHIHTATLVIATLKSGQVGLAGATGAMLDRTLIGMRSLIDRSLAEVRVSAGMPAKRQRLSVADFISEVKLSSTLDAGARECALTVTAVDPKLAVDVDHDMLLSAVGNLLQNAFKFTRHGTEVRLNAYAAADRVRIDVEDSCGGLPAGDVEHLFLPFTQRSADTSGIGLGLSICRRSVEANNGVLSVRDCPGSGCVFTIDLPRHAVA